jgi:hypothetical protein
MKYIEQPKNVVFCEQQKKKENKKETIYFS